MCFDKVSNEDFETTWKELKENLLDIHSDFDPFHWIIRLLFALFRRTQLYRFNGHILQFLPLVAIGIILFVLWVYYSCLHSRIVLQNFSICSTSANTSTPAAPASNKNITADRFCVIYDTILMMIPLYLGIMIIFNFLCTVFSSPGTCHVPHLNTVWKATQGQGGMCYLNPISSISDNSFHPEDCLKIDPNIKTNTERNLLPILLPSPNHSFCEKCKVQRPPRCHHCSKCNRCVLQMDHHCYFVNNCIGYYNYRTFMLTIIYLVIGCWYGLIVCAIPFYNTMREAPFKEFKFDWNHLRQVVVSMEEKELLIIVVCILLFAGIFLTVFLFSHLRYISMGVTTIERMQWINLQIDSTSNEKNRTTLNHNDVLNCFDQGIRKNFLQVFGECPILMALLPIRVVPPAPYCPQITTTTGTKKRM